METVLGITDCTEDAFAPNGNKPLTLQEVGIDRLLHRRILKRDSKGSYGTGGAGFFGILLDSNAQYPKEWLVLALWGSDGWLLLDGERLDTQVKRKRIPGEPIFAVLATILGRLSFILLPFLALLYLLAQLVRPLWDGVWRKLVGSEIYDVDITESNSTIKFKRRNNKISVLEIPLPGPDFRNGNRFIIKANHLEAWKISESGRIYC